MTTKFKFIVFYSHLHNDIYCRCVWGLRATGKYADSIVCVWGGGGGVTFRNARRAMKDTPDVTRPFLSMLWQPEMHSDICCRYAETRWSLGQCTMVFHKILYRKRRVTHEMHFLLLRLRAIGEPWSAHDDPFA